ncbi:MAG: SPOR domain-containing protein [Methylomonas sp.]|nr:SPOR domain-containing protein [Methylomonas sp.]
MARDYKHRAQSSGYGENRSRRRKAPTLWWRWLLVAGLIVAFVVFLNMVRSRVAELMAGKPETGLTLPEQAVKQTLPLQTQKPLQAEPEKKAEPEPVQPEEPRYDFYTILPQAETVIPDYEIQSRVREELVGKTKAAKYVMQAGSFREAAEAERHKSRLASLGIESWIEKAKVGSVIWHRVKIGPYENPTSVSTIKALLQKNGIGIIVTEQAK